MTNPFKGRSLSIVNDFTIDEQYYLYQKTRELKEALQSGQDVSQYRIGDPDFSIYLMFLEDSTRTKESFRNAAKFHGTRLNNFDANSSSFNKKESITDTVKMLFGYAQRSLFIIRSKQEGLCTWLDSTLADYAESLGYEKPSFINGGDGKHEHPTQEFLDEFSFLEQLNWKRENIHIALVGDLFHGRTVHSKADGLRVFHNVTVDLIAPEELQMPQYYSDKMKKNGFHVRVFSSVEEYLKQGQVADIWYFTRLQLERMGDEVREKEAFLRRSVTFSKEYFDKVTDETRFYHPLPRHREYPTIPSFLDSTYLNHWDKQSMNGYFTRIMEIALLTGKVGQDFQGETLVLQKKREEFVMKADIKKGKAHEHKVGIKPVENGIVIDHIGRGKNLEKIWEHIDKIRRLMGFNIRSSHGVYHTDNPDFFKGIISLPDVTTFDRKQLKMLGAISPGCTLNLVKDSQVIEKYRLKMPPRIYNLPEISCKNDNCISHPANFEPIQTEFNRLSDSTFVCRYCEKEHSYHEIWD